MHGTRCCELAQSYPHLGEVDAEGHGADRLWNVRAQAGKMEGRWPGARQAVRARQGLGLVQRRHEATSSAFLLLTPTSPLGAKQISCVPSGCISSARSQLGPFLTCESLFLFSEAGGDGEPHGRGCRLRRWPRDRPPQEPHSPRASAASSAKWG